MLKMDLLLQLVSGIFGTAGVSCGAAQAIFDHNLALTIKIVEIYVIAQYKPSFNLNFNTLH